jgi:hypothetical protein
LAEEIEILMVEEETVEIGTFRGEATEDSMEEEEIETLMDAGEMEMIKEEENMVLDVKMIGIAKKPILGILKTNRLQMTIKTRLVERLKTSGIIILQRLGTLVNQLQTMKNKLAGIPTGNPKAGIIKQKFQVKRFQEAGIIKLKLRVKRFQEAALTNPNNPMQIINQSLGVTNSQNLEITINKVDGKRIIFLQMGSKIDRTLETTTDQVEEASIEVTLTKIEEETTDKLIFDKRQMGKNLTNQEKRTKSTQVKVRTSGIKRNLLKKLMYGEILSAKRKFLRFQLSNLQSGEITNKKLQKRTNAKMTWVLTLRKLRPLGAKTMILQKLPLKTLLILINPWDSLAGDNKLLTPQLVTLTN